MYEINGYKISKVFSAIDEYAYNNPSFDASFARSCGDQYTRFRKLTLRQLKGLEKIVLRFRIDVGGYLRPRDTLTKTS